MSGLPPDSAFVVAMTDGESLWGVAEQLAAAQLDAIEIGNWQRQGKPNARRPKPTARPGVSDGGTEQIGGGTTYTPDEMAGLIARHTRGTAA